VSLDEVTWRFRKDEHAEGENAGPHELKGNGDPVRTIVLTRLGGLVDDGGQE